MIEYVYVVEADGIVKIGYAASKVIRRLEIFVTANPRIKKARWYRHDSASTLERTLHKAFASNRFANEWFSISIESAESEIIKHNAVYCGEIVFHIENGWIVSPLHDGRLESISDQIELIDSSNSMNNKPIINARRNNAGRSELLGILKRNNTFQQN